MLTHLRLSGDTKRPNKSLLFVPSPFINLRKGKDTDLIAFNSLKTSVLTSTTLKFRVVKPSKQKAQMGTF